MKLLVVSDTHGDIAKLKELLNLINKSIDGVIHCGDYATDAYAVAKLYPDLPFYTVRGNCDNFASAPEVKLIELEGKKILITHGHRYSVGSGIINLAYTGMENGAEVCLFGHTHIPFYEKHENVTIANPGSLSRPRGFSKASYAILDITKKDISIKIVEYK